MSSYLYVQMLLYMYWITKYILKIERMGLIQSDQDRMLLFAYQIPLGLQVRNEM